jgi:hypothetical protein
VDFAFDPGAEFTHRDGFGLPVFQGRRCRTVIWKTLLQRAPLVVRLQSRNFKRVRDGQPSDIERLLTFVDQVYEAQPGIDIFLGASDFFGGDFDGVILGLQLHEGRVAACLAGFVSVGLRDVDGPLSELTTVL